MIRAYTFPLERPHLGLPLSNGRQGVLLWGGGALLNATTGRAGFWDHRGGTTFRAAVDYPTLRDLLLSGREEELAGRFETRRDGRAYSRPCQMGAGRVVLRLPAGWEWRRGELDTHRGEVTLWAAGPEGDRPVRVVQSRDAELCRFFPDGVHLEIEAVKPVWDWVSDKLEADGVSPPERECVEGGLVVRQSLPEDPAVVLGARRSGDAVELATALGGESDGVKWAEALWSGLPSEQADQPRREAWWRGFHERVPRLEVPDPLITEVWETGIYLLAGTHPSGAPAATLQGAWMEDHRLPPWSNDYHFNINVQMVYGPCAALNLLDHLDPLWEMIRGWMPELLANGEAFFGVPGAMMLPHAMDDRCQVIGSFWSGTVDHGCTAWVAEMAWRTYRYNLDASFLRELAWPLLRGAFEGFYAMAERADAGLALPVTVSPEYHARHGGAIRVWGRNASFQLAAFHRMAELLPRAAEALGEPVDPRWREVTESLPPYSVVDGAVRGWSLRQQSRPRIALWEGQDLEESHRHHSHLAGIVPFQTLDPRDPAHRQVVKDSLTHWFSLGTGQWSGWAFPWAAEICARCDLPDAALVWLRHWAGVFRNRSGASLHDADFAGCGVFHPGPFLDDPGPPREMETMQLDGFCGAMKALVELLVQQRGEVLHVLPALPRDWRTFSFDGVRVEGAFLIGAVVRSGRMERFWILSERGGGLRIRVGEGLVQTLETFGPGERRQYVCGDGARLSRIHG